WLETLGGGVSWLTGLFGAFVFVEPSPYEIASLLAIILFVVTGFTMTSAVMPLAILLVLYNFGFAMAVIPVLDQPKTLLWVLVSGYLGATALFFAAILGTNTQGRLSLLLRGYTMAAGLAAVAGIVGYLQVPGADLLLLYGRQPGNSHAPNETGTPLLLPP